MFHVGQHVVCIKTPSEANRIYVEKRLGKLVKGPKQGVVYTIRKLYIAKNGGPYLLVEEIINPTYSNGDECGFARKLFRPLKKLSIDDFTETKEPVPA